MRAAVSVLSIALAAAAKTVVITVGGGTLNATNASTIFDPQVTTAEPGDTLVFNFTFGSHSATQGTFDEPCVHAHDSNATINGFDSSIRPAGNESAVTQLSVPVTDHAPIWFFDEATCGQGGVGAVNVNNSGDQPFTAYVLNAERLNGTLGANTTNASSSGAGSPTNTSGAGAPSATAPGAAGALGARLAAAVPLALVAAALVV